METIFSLFLTKEREKQGISQERLCRGLCAVSALSRYENGERIPDRLLMNALIQRLGKKNISMAQELQRICRRDGRHIHTAIMSVGRIVSAVFCDQSAGDVLFSEKVAKIDQCAVETGCISCSDKKGVTKFTEKNSAVYLSVLNNDVTNLENNCFVKISEIIQQRFIFLAVWQYFPVTMVGWQVWFC